MSDERSEQSSSPSGHQRLSADVRPVDYTLDLTLDPAATRFGGQVTITLALAAPTASLDLHAERLELGPVVVHDALGATVPARAAPGLHGALRIELERPLPAGRATLSLGFTGPLETVPEGLYRVEEGDAWYACTQFEPLCARRCFPCFDEPGFKAPFRVTLRTPEDVVALGNSRCVACVPDATTGGLVWTFAETPPLATYLVAFAVGPFELVEAPADAAPVPLRVVTTRGRAHLAGFALERTPRILDALTRWFGLPYPYDKLDLVGVPNFAAGAMENVGLVTFRERLLLLDAERAPAHDRLWAQVVIAHELAHMWFGNLVTMRWWEDLWLNEAFATWMEMACVAEVDPALEADLEAVQEGLRVMDHDSLLEARAIRQPIVDGGDVLNAFDGITYSKGAAIVRMTEAWLGSPAFRDAVGQYLVRHAHGNAETTDLLVTLAHVSGLPVAETLVTYLDQPGLPIVEVALASATEPALALQQRRYLPDPGRDTVETAAQRWHVPMVLRIGDERGEFARLTHLLTTPAAHLPVSVPAGRHVGWVHANAGEAGYYRWHLRDGLFEALLRDGFPHLTAAERVGLPEHVWALLEAGLLSAAQALDAFERLAADPHRLVLTGVCAGLRRLSRLAPPAPWAAYVESVLGSHVSRLGVVPRPTDTPADRLLRPVLVMAAADASAGADALWPGGLLALVPGLLDDLPAADPEVLQSALPIAAWRGDAALRDRLVVAVREAPTPAHRAAALAGLGGFSDPAVARGAWDTFLTDTLRAQDFFALVRGAARQPATQRALFEWLGDHFDAVVEKLGDEATAHLPALAGGVDDAAGRAAVEAFFAPGARRRPGTERNLRQSLEDIERRIRLRLRLAGPLVLALAQRRAGVEPPGT